MYRSTTKHHRMQGLFLWHCTDWKDVLYSAGWLEILPASRVTTFTRTRVRMASNTVETKHALTSTCQLTNDFFETMCAAFCRQCPNHEQRGFIVLSLGICIILKHFLCHSCVCVGRCMLLSLSHVTTMNKEDLGMHIILQNFLYHSCVCASIYVTP